MKKLQENYFVITIAQIIANTIMNCIVISRLSPRIEEIYHIYNPIHSILNKNLIKINDKFFF